MCEGDGVSAIGMCVPLCSSTCSWLETKNFKFPYDVQ